MKKFLLAFMVLLAVGVLADSGYELYKIWSATEQINTEIAALSEFVKNEPSSEEEDDGLLHIDWEQMLATNSDVIGWLEIPGTEISFPVVQTADNDYYLNHTYEGNYSIYGAVFASAQNDPALEDNNTVIFGHSTDIGGMFTSLRDFENYDYFQNHPLLYYYTPQAIYECEIFAFLETDSSSDAYMIGFGSRSQEILNSILSTSLFTRPLHWNDQHLITLSTCDLRYGYHSQQRLVLSSAVTNTIKENI